MDHSEKIKDARTFRTSPVFLGAVVIIFSLLIYLPALTTEFGLNDEYSMLAEKGKGPLGFVPARQLVVKGRAVGAMLLTLQSWSVQRVADLTVWRWVLWELCLFLSDSWGIS